MSRSATFTMLPGVETSNLYFETIKAVVEMTVKLSSSFS